MTDEPTDKRTPFSTDRGRPDRNPFVDRLKDHGDWALRSDEAESLRGRWRTALDLPASAPIILEIGPGNGFFFREMGLRFPEAGLVAIEVRFKRVWLTTKKAKTAGLTNFRVVHHRAQHLDLIFDEGELDCIVANHPDPWPKDRHHKHRLLQPSFARLAAHHLSPGGELWVKSDFGAYLPLAKEVFSGEQWGCLGGTEDLHNAPLTESFGSEVRFPNLDIQTNYERKSREAGKKIIAAGFLRLP